MNIITEKQYLEARKFVAEYEAQEAEKKLSIYEGCTKDNIVSNRFSNRGKLAMAYWVTKGKEIPDRNPEGVITYDANCDFYSLEHSTVPYKTCESAYKNMLKTFKRKGFIE